MQLNMLPPHHRYYLLHNSDIDGPIQPQAAALATALKPSNGLFGCYGAASAAAAAAATNGDTDNATTLLPIQAGLPGPGTPSYNSSSSGSSSSFDLWELHQQQQQQLQQLLQRAPTENIPGVAAAPVTVAMMGRSSALLRSTGSSLFAQSAADSTATAPAAASTGVEASNNTRAATEGLVFVGRAVPEVPLSDSPFNGSSNSQSSGSSVQLRSSLLPSERVTSSSSTAAAMATPTRTAAAAVPLAHNSVAVARLDTPLPTSTAGMYISSSSSSRGSSGSSNLAHTPRPTAAAAIAATIAAGTAARGAAAAAPAAPAPAPAAQMQEQDSGSDFSMPPPSVQTLQLTANTLWDITAKAPKDLKTPLSQVEQDRADELAENNREVRKCCTVC
jgi:hypothetical protein